MDHDSPEVIKKHVKFYIGIFVTLIFLTCVTVWVNSFKISFSAAVVVAMIVATFKSSLVAGYFMHLVGEKKIIHWTLLSIVIFLLALMVLPSLTVHEAAGHSVAPPVKKVNYHHEEGAGHEAGAAAEAH